ncbi:MAG: M20/M25/M40 family metallo-hydrolase [Vicinamibacteria bacterium]|nr:M20/M25/M40 family metallo-hydrolase [Vicinamibacteria bacterium]
MRFLATATVVAFAAASPAFSQEKVDYAAIQKIRDEALGSNSQVMETLRQLTDVIGPRLTGSPQLKTANEWTRKQLEDWGMANAHLESWGPFGRGWSFDKSSVTMVSPQGQAAPLIALPKAWTPGTNGAVRGKVVRPGRLESEADLEKWKGKLEGAILLIGDARELKAPEKNLFERYDENELAKVSQFEFPRPRVVPGAAPGQPFDAQAFGRRFAFQKTLREFLAKEKVVATIEASGLDAAMIRIGGGGSREKGEEPGPLALVMAAEHFNRIARLMDKKIDVELEIDVKARFHDDDLNAYNTIAEIPGSDPVKKNEIVMVGAHLDSWHPATGATDNAAGSAVAMEVMRILKDMKPKRTIRIGLWTGEEQGLLGSAAYVRDHFGSRPTPPPDARGLPSFMRPPAGPITLKADHAKFSSYFNLDNGTGKVRGVWAQQNAAAMPILEAWIKPFADLGVTTVSVRNTGGTDHLSFDAVGLPGFQMIQDEADYDTRTHHTNLDTYDRIQREDMMQASAVMASLVYHAANREELFPRKPLPKDAIPAPAPSPSPAAKKK